MHLNIKNSLEFLEEKACFKVEDEEKVPFQHDYNLKHIVQINLKCLCDMTLGVLKGLL